MSWLRFFAAAALAVAVAGCADRESLPKRQIFADASAPIWNAAILDSESEIESQQLGGLSSSAGWQVQAARFESTDLGWVLGIEEVAQGAPSLGADVDIDAGLVDILELWVEAAPALGRVEMTWLFTDGEERGRGRENLDMSLFMGDRLRASLGEHPEWRGQIRRLEWRFSRLPDGQRLLVRGWRALALEADSQSLAQALSQTWRVDIDRDLRPAILTLPGLERRLPIRVPPGGRFRVALGATADRSEEETTFLIRLRRRGDMGAELVELWRQALEPAEWGSWQEIEVDLEPWAGEDVTLELFVEARAWKPGEGLPAWGGPELISAVDSGGKPIDTRPDLILISADTLRADHLSLYGYARQTSPAIDRWARGNAILFRRAVAPAPWTLPSHISLFTGLDPLSHGGHYGLPAANRFVMLAEQLRAAGYKTYADTGGGYLHPAYGLGQGFDIFRYPSSQVPGPRDLSDAVRRSISFAEAQPGPVFIFLHSYETHEPYEGRTEHVERLTDDPASDRTWITKWVPPAAEEGYAHRRRFAEASTGEAPENVQKVIDLYDGRVANLDAQLEPLFTWLGEKERRRRSSAVIFTSDHGESLGEQGRGGHASLEKQLLHIPMLLALPGGEGAGREIEARVRLYDVMPTLLELAGVEAQETSPDAGAWGEGPVAMDGESLLQLVRGPGSLEQAAREAWAASPSTNAGVAYEAASQEDGDLRRFRFHPESWAPGGFARFESLSDEKSSDDPSRGELVSEPASDQAEVARALRIVQRRLEEEADGLEIFVTNGGPGPMILELAGSAIQNHRVKDLESAGRVLEWRGQVEGARLRLQEGERRRLLVITPRRGDLVLRSDNAEIQIDLGAARLPMTLETALGAGGDEIDEWRRSQGETPPRSGIRLRWLGQADANEAGGGVDLELQRQLRALGYTG